MHHDIPNRAELAAELRAHAAAHYTSAYVADLCTRAADALAWPVGDVYRHERPLLGDFIDIELTGAVRANGWVEARMIGAGSLGAVLTDGAYNQCVVGCTLAIDPAALGTSWIRVQP